MAARKTKRPASKGFILCVIIQSLAAIVTIYTIVMCTVTGDLSPLTVLIPAIFVDASATTAVVLHKRKSENIIAFLEDQNFKNTATYFMQQGVDFVDIIRAMKE